MTNIDDLEFALAFQQHFSIELDEDWLNGDLRAVTYAELWRLVSSLRSGVVPPRGSPPVCDDAWRDLVRFVAMQRQCPDDDVHWDATVFCQGPAAD